MLSMSLVVTVNMESKRDASKETTECNAREVVENISVSLLFSVDIQMFIEKGTTLTWQKIKDTFVEDFKEDLED